VVIETCPVLVAEELTDFIGVILRGVLLLGSIIGMGRLYCGGVIGFPWPCETKCET